MNRELRHQLLDLALDAGERAEVEFSGRWKHQLHGLAPNGRGWAVKSWIASTRGILIPRRNLLNKLNNY